jgi:hypothetical protein
MLVWQRFDCPVCYIERQPMVWTCGHSVCRHCSDKLFAVTAAAGGQARPVSPPIQFELYDLQQDSEPVLPPCPLCKTKHVPGTEVGNLFVEEHLVICKNQNLCGHRRVRSVCKDCGGSGQAECGRERGLPDSKYQKPRWWRKRYMLSPEGEGLEARSLRRET